MIILFDPQDEERRPDDQLDIYWISSGNEAIEDIPIPQTRSPPKKVTEKVVSGSPVVVKKKISMKVVDAVKMQPLPRQPLPAKFVPPTGPGHGKGGSAMANASPFNAQFTGPPPTVFLPQWNAMPNVVPMGPYRPF